MKWIGTDKAAIKIVKFYYAPDITEGKKGLGLLVCLLNKYPQSHALYMDLNVQRRLEVSRGR
jgi:hypothetical protein